MTGRSNMSFSERLFSCRKDGFSLVEIIVVLAIIGILAAVTVGVMLHNGNAALISERDILKAHLRYAQGKAMSGNGTWRMILSANSYQLERNGVAVIMPAEENKQHDMPKGINITAVKIAFDKWGQPVDGSGVPLGADTTIVLGDGFNPKQVITVTKNTGFIP